MPDYKERRALIEAIEKLRGTTVITYITSTRPGFQTEMALDSVPIFHRHLRKLGKPQKEMRIDLFIHSDGGDGIVPWRLVTLLREYCSELNLLVPHRAFSAATLLALGCDNVVMHPMGNLGPTDATVMHPFNPQDPRDPRRLLGISVEDVSSYISLVKEEVGIRHEDELVQAFGLLAQRVHPLALGNVKRFTSQSRLMGIKLLKKRVAEPRMTDHEIIQIVDSLTSRLYYHGHPIGRTEAVEDLQLSFVKEATSEEAEAMWSLYEAYESEMKLEVEWQYLLEAISKSSPQVPKAPTPAAGPGEVNASTAKLEALTGTIIESRVRSDVRKFEFEATVWRDWTGEFNAKANMVGDRWQTE